MKKPSSLELLKHCQEQKVVDRTTRASRGRLHHPPVLRVLEWLCTEIRSTPRGVAIWRHPCRAPTCRYLWRIWVVRLRSWDTLSQLCNTVDIRQAGLAVSAARCRAVDCSTVYPSWQGAIHTQGTPSYSPGLSVAVALGYRACGPRGSDLLRQWGIDREKRVSSRRGWERDHGEARA